MKIQNAITENHVAVKPQGMLVKPHAVGNAKWFHMLLPALTLHRYSSTE
jgi:hypothetical protein